MKDLIQKRFAENIVAVTATADHLAGPIVAAAEMIIESYRNGGGVFTFGNGGSAADAQHIAGELVGRFLLERPGFKAQALTADASVLTSLANDYTYEMIFASQLQANARPGDVAIGLSTSGNSPNVVAALEYAHSNNIKTVAITGEGGGKCAAVADVLLDISATDTPRIQEAGTVVYHILCELIEASLSANS
ncbi:MAG: SIS domain-containing protein [Phycisphaerae bacterium]|nr:SIS domain-containing protein [Phycisphaerae bacterium]